MQKKIAIIDDVVSYANSLKRDIEDTFDDALDIEIVIVSKPMDIENFNPSGFGLLIVDQNLFNGFNAKSETVDDFTQGESLVKKYVEDGYIGRIILYTGDYKLVEKRNNKGFFATLFGEKPIAGVEYIDKGTTEGIERLKAITGDFLADLSA